MSNQQKLSKLRKTYGNSNVVIAEAFVSLLKIKKTDKLYPSAIEWAVIRIDSSSDILSARDSKEFAKDNKEKKIGRVHKKIIKEIEGLYNINEVIEGIKPVSSSKLDQPISSRPLPSPTSASSVKKVKPEVTLESNIQRVEKGGSVTLTWTSKNATKIRRTNIPGVTAKTPVNGFIQVEDIRRRRDFYIIVESANGDTAESKVQTLVETQEYKKQKEKSSIDNFDKEKEPEEEDSKKNRLSRLVSPTIKKEPEKKEEEEKEKIIPQENSLNDNILLSIDKTLSGILKLLTTQLKLNQNIFDKERIKSEKNLRLSKEERMEESGGTPGGELIKSGAEKMLSPFKSIIDKIVNFLFFTLLGRVFTEIMDWMNDPQNKDKVDAIGRFIKDAWPLIVGLSVLFLTPLFGFIVGTVQFLTGTYKTLKGLKGLIDRFIFKKGKPPKPKSKVSGRGAGEAILSTKKILETKKSLAKDVLNRGLKAKGAIVNGKYISVTAEEATSILSKQSNVPKKPSGSGAKPGFKMPKFRLSGGNIASAVIGLGLETGTNLIFGNIRENMALNAAEKINLLPENEKKQAIEKIKQQIKTQEKLGILGNSETINYLKYVLENVDSSTSNTQTLSVGGKVFSGQVTNNDGKKVSGAGKDTQAFPIMGGGMAVLQPGETVLQPGVRETIIKEKGFDILAYNKGKNANKPQSLNADIKLMNTGGVVGADTIASSSSKQTINTGGLIAAAKSIIGMGKGVVNQCAITTRAALSRAGISFGAKTSIGDLDTPKGPNQFTRNPAMAASLAGSDFGKVIKNKGEIKTGDLIFWKADRDKGGTINKGAITHVGIAADDGLKNQYDHNVARGWHYRPHWHSSGDTSWLAGIRLGASQSQKAAPAQPKKQPTFPGFGAMMFRPAGVDYGGDPRGDSFTGLISSSSGIKIPQAQDPIMMRAERGEYVVPKIATQKIGVKTLDSISALDPNFRIKNPNVEPPRPLSRASYGAAPITLPPITQGMEQVGSSSGSGTPIPVFSATPAGLADVRMAMADIYGIVG
jgi:hypothetical protein